ncbi:hypothetical protein TNCV_3266981 [Trichonephila clavipes]|nr:hypothetical protein TNCV_3266981 [Trichonephila clavipes]
MVCTFNVCSLKTSFFCDARDAKTTEMDRGSMRFNLSSDTGYTHIWIDQGTRNNSSNIIVRDWFEGHDVLVWRDVTLSCRTDFQIFEGGSIIMACYCNKISFHMCFFLGALWVCSSFSWVTGHRTVAVKKLFDTKFGQQGLQI